MNGKDIGIDNPDWPCWSVLVSGLRLPFAKGSQAPFLRSANKSKSAAFVPIFLDFMFKSFPVHCDANVKGDFLPKIPEY